MPSPSDLRPRQDRRASQLDVIAPMPAVAEWDIERRYARYRTAMPRIALVCPAERLESAETARWVRKQGITVAAASSSELALAVSAGIEPTRLVMFGDGGQWGPIRCALNASVRQFVVNSCAQIPVLAHYARRRQQVLLDVGTVDADTAIEEICTLDRLDLVGLHSRLDPRSTAPHCYAAAIHPMVAQMARVRGDRGLIMSRLSLAGPLGLAPERVAAVIEDAIDESCARWPFPRPALALTPVP